MKMSGVYDGYKLNRQIFKDLDDNIARENKLTQ